MAEAKTMTDTQQLLNNARILVENMRQSGYLYSDALACFKREFIRQAIIAAHGNQERAAHEIGIHRNTLGRELNRLKIDRGPLRAGRKKNVQPLERLQ